MEYKQLEGFEEIEANENGDIRFSLKHWKPHEKVFVSFKDGAWKSYYVKYQTRDAQQKKDKSISCMNLIARLFVKNELNHHFAQPKDGDMKNYKASNIEWVKSRKHKTCTPQHEKREGEGYIKCCGALIREDGMKKHEKSKKHILTINKTQAWEYNIQNQNHKHKTPTNMTPHFTPS